MRDIPLHTKVVERVELAALLSLEILLKVEMLARAALYHVPQAQSL